MNVGIVFYLKIEYKSVKYKDEGSKGSKKAMLHVFLLKSYSELGPGVKVQSKDECIFLVVQSYPLGVRTKEVANLPLQANPSLESVVWEVQVQQVPGFKHLSLE